MRLYAQRTSDGEVIDIFLIREGASFGLWQASFSDGPLPLPIDALPAIFKRYGKPIEDGLDVAPLLVRGDEDGPIEVPLQPDGQALLHRFRYLPYGWVYVADYLLWQPPAPHEALAAPAPLVTSALEALGRAMLRQA